MIGVLKEEMTKSLKKILKGILKGKPKCALEKKKMNLLKKFREKNQTNGLKRKKKKTQGLIMEIETIEKTN